MANIEELRKEVDEIKIWLEKLKSFLSTISETERQEKVEEFNVKIEKTREKIQSEINSLSSKTDDDSKMKKEESEALLNSLNETVWLYSSIVNPNEGTWGSQMLEQSQSTLQQQNKNIFDKTKDTYIKTKDWIRDQRYDVWDKGKWKTEWWKNLLRTAWIALTWVWAVSLAYKWIKKLWNWGFWKEKTGDKEKEAETNEISKKGKKNSWWKKWLAVLWIWTAGFLWYKNWDKIKWLFEKEKPLTIEESLEVAAWEINCGKVDENIYRQNFEDWIKYDKENHNIVSYWESTQIDENNMCLVWLETVKFKTNTELVHAANIVNCLKRNLKWKWWAKQAFSETKTWWDIAFYFSDKWVSEVLSWSNTDFWWNLLGVAWAALWWATWYKKDDLKVWIGWALWLWIWWYILWNAIDNNSSLWKCCSTIKEGNNFSRFIAYLNKLQIW